MVISNVNFDPCASPNLDARKGGGVDEEVLRKVFTELDYLVVVNRDLTAQVKNVQMRVQNVNTNHRVYLMKL